MRGLQEQRVEIMNEVAILRAEQPEAVPDYLIAVSLPVTRGVLVVSLVTGR